MIFLSVSVCLSHFYNLLYKIFIIKSVESAKNETSRLYAADGKEEHMPKPRTQTGEKNLISGQLIELRRQNNLSQRDLAYRLQLAGYDMDKNVITRIETNQRYVSDFELSVEE